MRHPKRILAAIERCLPGLTAREWGTIAVEAARRAGADGDDVFRLSLAIHRRINEANADRARKRRAPGRRGRVIAAAPRG